MLQVSLGEVVIPYWEMMPPSYRIVWMEEVSIGVRERGGKREMIVCFFFLLLFLPVII